MTDDEKEKKAAKLLAEAEAEGGRGQEEVRGGNATKTSHTGWWSETSGTEIKFDDLINSFQNPSSYFHLTFYISIYQ